MIEIQTKQKKLSFLFFKLENYFERVDELVQTFSYWDWNKGRIFKEFWKVGNWFYLKGGKVNKSRIHKRDNNNLIN